MVQNGVRRLAQLTTLIILAVFLPMSAGAAEINIKPGKFSHFNLITPESIVAGENATLQLQAVDAYSNIIQNFNELNTEYRLAATGSANLSPLTFRASAFKNGVFQFILRDNAAETVSLSVFESASPIALLTKEVRVVAARPAAFRITAPRSAGAGEKFDLRITAIDAYGNVAVAPMQGKNLNVLFKGDTEPRIVNQSMPDFSNGVCVMTLAAEKIGSVAIEIKDLISGVSGTSERIEVTNGVLSAFRVVAPRESIAGEPFEVAIVALDANNNLVRNYAASGSGVALSTTGSRNPHPSTILAYEFQNGQVRVQLRYDVPEEIHIVATEISRKVSSKSEIIRIIKPVASRYEVTTPESAIAGQRFKIKVTVFNQNNTVIKNYSSIGPDVILNATGAGRLTPSRVPATEFVNGTAVVDVQYNKSEAFSITAVAAEASDRTQLPPAVKKRLKRSGTQAPDTKAKAVAEAKPLARKTKSAAKTELTAVMANDAAKRVTLSMSSTKTVKYSVSAVSRNAKKWIVVRLSPAASTMSSPVRLNSDFIGDVVAEDDGKGGVVLKLELLKAARVQVQKEKSGLILQLK
ncbi:MAG TPA: hypothetical protein VLH56_16105 [Dissulfurispiraceae bacterium]|nr:hypothetical protein [Dissulfurispiraceae bacterium]